MKNFIKAMADAVRPNQDESSMAASQENLRNLVTFIEKEEKAHDDQMEIDKKSNKRKTLPGSDEGALSGEDEL